MIHRKTNMKSKKGYLFHSVLFFILTISLTDCLIRKATNLCPYRKLHNRSLARQAYINLREGIAKECFLSDKTLNKTATNGEATTWIRAIRNGESVNIYYESLCGRILQQTLDHIGPYGRESIRIIQVIKNPEITKNPENADSSGHEDRLNRNTQMGILLKKQIQRASINFPYLKDMRTETIEKLYERPEAQTTYSEKWTREVNRGVKATLENLKALNLPEGTVKDLYPEVM